MELNLARDVKDHMKGFSKYVTGKRKTRENIGLLLHGAGELVTHDMEKSAVLNAFVASAFTSKTKLWKFKAPESRGESLEH